MMSDEVIIRGETAMVTAPDGRPIAMPLRQLLEQVVPPSIDSRGMRLPHEVRFTYSRGGFLILACEYAAGPYTLSWITEDSPVPFGSGAKYQTVTLSLPYVVVLAVFQGDYLTDFNECFFRSAPLTDMDEENELLYPGLLNCSRFVPPEGRPLSWICTQKLNRVPIFREKDFRKRITAGLEVLRHCLFQRSFNRSSDHHEYSSWYSESRHVDERICTAQRWHDETVKDRFVGLDIPWLKTNETLKSVVDRIFDNRGVDVCGIKHVRQLARLIINNSK